MSYQGLLLDDLGAPRTGTTDVTVRIFDSLTNGANVYTQIFTSVPLTDGVFAIERGPTGEASDLPTDPLTTSLLDALIGDVGATGPNRFLEVTVGTESALSPTQVLAVPYALRAEVATTALEASSMGAVSAELLTTIFEESNLDNSGPKNSDPAEGAGDTDMDGLANFVDSDNDNDGLDDDTEVSQGSDLNLVTPTLDFPKATVPMGEPYNLAVTGTNFVAGMSVLIGSEMPAPMNLTATSFDIEVNPEIAGVTLDLRVTRPNGENAHQSAITILPVLSHSITSDDRQFSFDVASAESVVLGGGTNGQYWLEGSTRSFPGEEQDAVAFDPTGAVVGLRCRDTGSTCSVEYAVDSDADLLLADETRLVLDVSDVAIPRVRAPSIAFDPSGNPVLAFNVLKLVTGFTSKVAHDRDGNGDFAGPNELVSIDFSTGTQHVHGEVAVDASARVAYAYYDGNFADPGETVTIQANSDTACDVTTGDGNPVAVGYVETDDTIRLLVDANDDGDVADSDENMTLSVDGAGVSTLRVGYNDSGRPFIATEGTANGTRVVVVGQ